MSYNRRKFRSQTSDNMDRWKAEVVRVKEEKRREEERSKRESLRRKKIRVPEKVGKSRNTTFFQWFVAPEGRKVGSLKQRVRSPLGKWEMKNCTPLWHEAHFEVKMYNTHQVRTTFGSWDVEKVQAVARSTCRSQNVQNTPEVRTTFGRSDVVSRGRRKGWCTLSKVSKTWGFCSISKNDGRRGTFEEDLQRCMVRGRRSTRDMFIRDVRRSGRWFPERVAFWSIRSSGLLRWFCVTGAALPMTRYLFFVAGAVG